MRTPISNLATIDDQQHRYESEAASGYRFSTRRFPRPRVTRTATVGTIARDGKEWWLDMAGDGDYADKIIRYGLRGDQYLAGNFANSAPRPSATDAFFAEQEVTDEENVDDLLDWLEYAS